MLPLLPQHTHTVWSPAPPTTHVHVYNPAQCHKIHNKVELFQELALIGDWDLLCSTLGVSEAQMGEIRYSMNQNKKQACLGAYVDSDEACWEEVIRVVAAHPFNNVRLAKRIAQNHNIEYTDT